MILVPLLELLSYIAFSFLAGSIVFRFVRKDEAAIRTPRSDVLASAASAALVTSGPVINLVSLLGAQNGYGQALSQVLFQFTAGKVWIGIFVLAIGVWLLLYFDKLPVLTLILFLGMLFLDAYGSHTATEGGLIGAFAHFIHLGAAVFWVGVLIHVCFYAPEHFSWESFLKWFTPFAILLVIAVIASGIIVMLFAMDIRDYGNALMLTYGQMLFIKHIVFVPVLIFAVINGFLARKAHRDPDFRPFGWIRAEAILLAIVFICTAVLGTSATPADIPATLRNEGSALIFGSIFPRVTAESVATWHWGVVGVICFIGFFFFLTSIIYFFRKRAAASFALAAAFVASGLLYSAIMTSLQF
ncbi:CopD family protein [Terribacillus sp. 179-K 1B1 HS]|uniref:copper resistance D family protein n=1 Tax=Terribacillus sp. 179-K 1B1 HS TaxID=3142388 RepID=UPI0039A244D6